MAGIQDLDNDALYARCFRDTLTYTGTVVSAPQPLLNAIAGIRGAGFVLPNGTKFPAGDAGWTSYILNHPMSIAFRGTGHGYGAEAPGKAGATLDITAAQTDHPAVTEAEKWAKEAGLL